MSTHKHEAGSSFESLDSLPSWPGVSWAIREAWQRIAQDPAPFLLYLGVLSLFEAGAFTLNRHSDTSLLVASMESLLILVLLPFVTRYQLALARGIKRPLHELLELDFLLYLYVILGGLLADAIVLVAAVCLIFPLIWAFPWVSMMLFLIVDTRATPIAALRESKRLTTAHKGKVWAVFAVAFLPFIPASLLSFIPVVGNLLVLAWSVVAAVAMAMLYVWLASHVEAPEASRSSSK